MALGFISYSIENDKAFIKKVNDSLQIVNDLRVPFKAIAQDFRKSRRAIFKLKSAGQYPDFQGEKIGKLWKNPGRPDMRKRTPSMTPYQYAKIKKYGGTGYPLLKASGRLERSLTERGGENIELIEKTALLVGTSVPHGEFHQSDAPRKKIPLRKFLFIGPEAGNVAQERGTLDRWIKIIDDYLTKKLKAKLESEVK
jgi:phage gpG-like protein